jgi:hypothetical protein
MGQAEQARHIPRGLKEYRQLNPGPPNAKETWQLQFHACLPGRTGLQKCSPNEMQHLQPRHPPASRKRNRNARNGSEQNREWHQKNKFHFQGRHTARQNTMFSRTNKGNQTATMHHHRSPNA